MSRPSNLRGASIAAAIFTALASALAPSSGAAQNAIADSESPSLEEVLVTARKRSERAIDVPVAISAISATEIDRQGLSTLSAIADRVPDLRIETNIVALGGSLSLRGISSATSTASIEQTVTVNVDGVPISYAGVVRLGQFDLAQAEVLKGPQALFFGKNASGGVISLNAAEPTDEFDLKLRTGYESEAREYMGEASISGPLSERVKGRLAVRYSDMDGWLDNVIPPGSSPAFGPTNDKAPGTEEFAARTAWQFDLTDNFQIKLKGSFNDVDTQGSSLAQRYVCPSGVPQGPSIYPGETDCELDNRTVSGDLPRALHAVDPRFPADGVPYAELEQYLLVGDLNYQPSDALTLTSVTGYYHIDFDGADHVGFGPIAVVSFADTSRKRSFSEELRLSFDGPGPLDWMIGMFYQDDTFRQAQQVVIAPATVIPDMSAFLIDGETYSPFLQLSYELTDQWTLTGGARYSHETKEQDNARFGSQLPHEITFEDVSPEATLSFKPVPDAHFYVSYKEGYKSGGFQTEYVRTPTLLNQGRTVDNSYDAERVKGFELGAKALLLDNQLRISAALFHYRYEDLQLGRFDPILVVTALDNIGEATTRGAELELEYSPPIEGLNLFGAITYNIAEYDEFQSACYSGQTVAEGCVAGLQDLAGRPLPRAPEYSGNIGGSYESALGSELGYRINVGLSYTGEYEMMTELVPGSEQDGYVSVDAGMAIGQIGGANSDKWEVALIGRNLTNEIHGSSAGQVPATGSATTRADIFTTVSRGRELWLRLTYKPFAD